GLARHLLDLADADARLVVGLDFAFSLPGWYRQSLTPAMATGGLAGWLRQPEWPLWTTAPAHGRLGRRPELRRTEAESRGRGAQPKSVFQLVGAGQVGRGALYGMQMLHRLRSAGFSIWPFDKPLKPLAVEIYPRLLTGPVLKSRRAGRERRQAELGLTGTFLEAAAASDDAFDA